MGIGMPVGVDDGDDETGVIRSERIRNEWRPKESALVGVLAAKLMPPPA